MHNSVQDFRVALKAEFELPQTKTSEEILPVRRDDSLIRKHPRFADPDLSTFL